MTEMTQSFNDSGSAIKRVPSPNDSLGIATFLKLNRLGFLDFLYGLCQEHGDISRFKIAWQAMTVIASPEATRQISLDPKQFIKGKNYELIRRYAGGRNVLTSDGDDWLWQRKMLSSLFTPKAIAPFANLMMNECLAMFETWESLSEDEPFDLDMEMFKLTANITLKAIFSNQGNYSFKEIEHDVFTLVEFLTKRQQAIVQVPLWFPSKNIREYNAAHKRLYDFLEEMVQERLSKPKEEWEDDFLSRTLDTKDPEGQQMSRLMVKNQSLTFFVGGHHSSALTMIFALYEIARNPHVEAQLVEEIDSITGGKMPTLDDMRQMSYTLRVIKETMRLYPPIPYYPRDAVEDTVLDGYDVKAGDALLVFPYAIHRHPDYWENPEVFDPDRFTPEREKAQHPHAYVPFGSGQRICIGNHFALLECQVLLALIHSRYRLRIPDGFEPHVVSTGLLHLTTGMPMYLERR